MSPPRTHSELIRPGPVAGAAFPAPRPEQDQSSVRDGTACPERENPARSFGSVTPNRAGPSACHPERGRRKSLFLANGGETSTVNYKCSLKSGCTGEPKVPALVHVHLAWPCQGGWEQLCQDPLTSYPQLRIDTIMLWETEG